MTTYLIAMSAGEDNTVYVSEPELNDLRFFERIRALLFSVGDFHVTTVTAKRKPAEGRQIRNPHVFDRNPSNR